MLGCGIAINKKFLKKWAVRLKLFRLNSLPPHNHVARGVTPRASLGFKPTLFWLNKTAAIDTLPELPASTIAAP